MHARFAWRPDANFDTPAIVVVDVLSWTTTVTLAAARGVSIIPAADPAGDRFWLRPSNMRHAELPDPPVLTISSPNGSALAAEIPSSVTVVAGCLRNARAVADWLIAHDYDTVTVIAAGEHWQPSGRWRRGAEDYLGAAAILSALEAGDTATRAWASHGDHAARHVRDCLSGQELIAKGFPEDVVLAGELDADDTVPVRVEGVFLAASP